MPFTHHSHSGQFCAHARNTLRDTLTRAAHHHRMTVVALTEHVSRSDRHLYPEERAEGIDGAELSRLFDGFHVEATKVRKELQPKLDEVGAQILIGFEAEWVDAEECAAQTRSLMSKEAMEGRDRFDFFVGSVHHVLGEPIDFDRPKYEKAREVAGGTDEKLFGRYFDEQMDMLEATKPLVVGHFDLIRLLSDEPNADLKEKPEIWHRILRNLQYIKGYGGCLEVNSSALRKGLKEPYPSKSVCVVWKDMGGDFVLSDDSHGVEQIAACYGEAVEVLRELGVVGLAYLWREGDKCVVRQMEMGEVMELPFWDAKE